MAHSSAKKLIWVTDPHLNHVSIPAWDTLIESVANFAADAIVITGDISEADDVGFQLNRLAEAFTVPIYFVLGNHDFYQSSIAKTRRHVIDTARENPLLHFLTDCDPVRLSDNTVLVGDDGWGDATKGDFDRSPVRLNDFLRIEDFYLHDPSRWKTLLKEQGAFSAGRLAQKLDSIPKRTQQVIVATHVPPFCESCWYEGQTTDDDWAPFFVCGQVGNELRHQANRNPDTMYTVICGHTHHPGVAKMTDNLIVYTGAAQYGHPAVEGVLSVGPRLEIQLAREN